MLFRTLTLVAFSAAMTFSAANAQEAQIGARQGQMRLMSANLGVLGGMAQARSEYDAVAAQTAANNLFHLASIDNSALWVEDSDTMSVDGTRAMPAVWDDLAAFQGRFDGLLVAATAMQAAAGIDLASLQGAMTALGGACGGCHENNREPR
jgi:cytochrome c556